MNDLRAMFQSDLRRHSYGRYSTPLF